MLKTSSALGIMSILVVSGSHGQSTPNRLAVGDARIKGERLQAHESRWSTVVVQGETRRPTGLIAERLEADVMDGRPVWVRTQWRELPGDRRVETRITVDRRTLAPIQLEHVKEGPFPDPVVRRFHVQYGPDGARGERVLVNGERQPIDSMPLGSTAFETDVMGLVLAALPLDHGFEAELPSVYAQLNEQYFIRPRVTGTMDFANADGGTVTAWKVEVEWLNLRTNDIYTGGDTGSGGTYYVVKNPPAGFPHVPRYVNENSDIVVTFEPGGER